MRLDFDSAQAFSSPAPARPAPVEDILGTPWRWVCSIQVDYPEKVFHSPGDVSRDTTFGSGVLITPRHVLMNAHTVVGLKIYKQHTFVVQPKKIMVAPGRDDGRLNARPFGEYKVVKINIAPQYLTAGNQPQSAPFDYAVLELNRDVGNKTFRKINGRLGWWGQAYNSYIRSADSNFRQLLANRKVNVAGYPGNDEFTPESTPAGIQYYDFDLVKNAFPKINNQVVPLIRYAAETISGQSGGPVWIKEKSNGRRYLVAIHRAHEAYSNLDREGVLITPSLVQQLYSWGIPKQSLSIYP